MHNFVAICFLFEKQAGRSGPVSQIENTRIMCKKEKYSVIVSGKNSDREKLAGCLVMNAANLVTRFSNVNATIMFHFQYKGDAKLVLRRVSKILNNQRLSGNELVFREARAVVTKCN